MKRELSSLELHFLINEFKELEGAKVSKIYQPDKKDLVFELFSSGKGKKLLRVIIPNFVFLTKEKPENPKVPMHFCSVLRKYISNSFIEKIDQILSERIFLIVFNTKEKKYRLYFELFSKGNAILCEEDDTIISAIELQKWKTRIVRRGEKYVAPSRDYNILKLEKKDIVAALKNTEKGTLVAVLAIDLGLGGQYSEEICTRTGISKDEIPSEVGLEQAEALLNALNKIIKGKVEARIIKKEGMYLDAVPLELKSYDFFDKEDFSSFSEAIDSYVLKEFKVITQEKSKYEQKIKDMEKLIAKQEEQLKKIEKGQAENKEKAEKIYENYKVVDDILSQLEKARHEYSWDEIKKKLKGHKIIKQVNEKDGKIVVEL